MDRRVDAAWDVALYAASAVAAFVVPLTTDVPLDREWARVAAPSYTAGAVVAVVLVARRAGLVARSVLATALFAAVALVPLAVHVLERAEPASTIDVKSDVLVVEAAATSLSSGRNPYVITLGGDALASWSTATRTHFAYLPATIAFGLPRGMGGPGPLTDARVSFLIVTIVVGGTSLLASRITPTDRLRVIQVLLVAATGAPLVFTSGKELPVLALLLASLVALDRDKPVAAGVAAGVAASAHQLAWAVLPFLVLAFGDAFDRKHCRRAIVAAGATMAALIAPIALWDVEAFVDDAVLFPLGYGQPADAEGSFTPGSALAGAFPDTRWMIVLLVAVATTVGAVLLARTVRSWSAANVALAAGLVLLIALLLAPRTRIAYFAFPLNLLLWSAMLRIRPAGQVVVEESPVAIPSAAGG
jgi:hypothetical protein